LRLGPALVAFAALPLLLGIAGCTRYRVPSSSMEPTLHCGRPAPGCLGAAEDRLYVRATKHPRRGDIVLFRTTTLAAAGCGEKGVFIKRVVGLPGETVAERAGFVFVDSKRLPEPYVSPARRDSQSGRWHVAPNTYFLMGDNRASSCDSRIWGSMPRRNLIGKVVGVLRNGRRISVR
jgi:signal peptidase I